MRNTFITNADQGGEVIADTAAHTGTFHKIHAIGATQFTAVSGNVSGLAGVTIPAQFEITGTFTSITLASGSVIAYRR